MPHEPFQLFIASDNVKIVVATRRPMVDGEEESTTNGSITEITAVAQERTSPSGLTSTAPSRISTQSPPLSDAGPVAALVVGIAALVVAVGCGISTVWWLGVLAGLITVVGGAYVASRLYPPRVDDWPRSHVVLTDWQEQDAVRKARSAVTTITGAWPKLRSVTSAPAPDEVLARAVWDLAQVLSNRQTMRSTRQGLIGSLVDLPRDSQMHTEVQARIDQAHASYAAVDADVTQRLAHLTGLAEQCQRFLRERAALEKARRVVRSADQVLGTIPALDQSPAPSASEELAHSTSAVLGAYRELSLQLGVDDVL
jgi:hypothetical protein